MLQLPSGRLVRGRGLLRPTAPGGAAATKREGEGRDGGAGAAGAAGATGSTGGAAEAGGPSGVDGPVGDRLGAMDGPGGARGAQLSPDFGLYLLGKQPPEFTWTARWVRWPDFRLPSDRADAIDAIVEAWTRSAHERVEVACGGGHGRTGTALACMAVLDGVEPGEAVAYVRAHYDAHAVETPWQKRYVRKFSARPSSEAR